MKIVNIILILLFGILITSCASPQQRAQKLYDYQRYEELVSKYGDLPIADKAREKLNLIIDNQLSNFEVDNKDLMILTAIFQSQKNFGDLNNINSVLDSKESAQKFLSTYNKIK
jgi:predicted aldo/keto reductase-like oxidoreductase